MKRFVVALILFLPCLQLPAERINQEGRILGALPAVTNLILFNTSNADAVVSAMQIFPVTNPWNECISNRPVLANSDAMITQIMTNLSANHRTLVTEYEMNFVLVPDNQPRKLIGFFNYADESDLDGGSGTNGLYPIPTNLPIETWPVANTNTLLQWQTNSDDSDRHAIMVAPGAGSIWETWETMLTNGIWVASNGAKFDLNSNSLRPTGWTSGDAAGFPMFQALVRYDEAERGMVEHACRLVVGKTRNEYIYPATHHTGTNTNPNLPAMGQRLRLKSAFVIPANWTKEEKAVLLGLKKYGAMVADNGSVFSISVTPDDRWPKNCFNNLTSISITNFEVIQTTGASGGPRSAGAPSANAGTDQTAPVGTPFSLQGVVVFTGTPPVIQWKLYSGPGTVTFGNAALTNTTATFSAPGSYTLELSADDGVHAVAYDAVVITVTNAITMTIGLAGTNVSLNWSGGVSPYVVQQTGSLSPAAWSDVVTTSVSSTVFPATNSAGFFRVKGQ